MVVEAERGKRWPARRRGIKPDAEIVLLCNPRAGGRWRELAGILDSEEAGFVRRIVTDSVEDVSAALGELGRDTRLICVYGGDGTIQRVLDHLNGEPGPEMAYLALLGGGTMNVTSRWCGFSRNPARNFRHVIRGYLSGDLLLKEVPMLEVRTGTDLHRGFTFGMGPIVRLLDHYERGRKGKRAAMETALKAMTATWLGGPANFEPLLHNMVGEIELDGQRLPHDNFAAVFANVTGQINPGVEPFVRERQRDTFYVAAYAVGARELTMALPFLARGWLPMDLSAVFSANFLKRGREVFAIPTDPRYVNATGRNLTICSQEPIYTVDGEILSLAERRISVDVGATLKLAVGPGTAVGQTLKLARGAVTR
jgi:diacylglycerol kinase family enzyme